MWDLRTAFTIRLGSREIASLEQHFARSLPPVDQDLIAIRVLDSGRRTDRVEAAASCWYERHWMYFASSSLILLVDISVLP